MKSTSGLRSAFRRAFVPSLICFSGTASAQLYWDTDGATPGSATSSTPVWGVTDAWTTDSSGSSATTAYTPGSDVIFSAGTNGTGASTLKVNGNVTANSLTFQEGTVTVSSTDAAGNFLAGQATLTIGAGGITLADGLNGQLYFGASMGNLVVSSNQSWTNSTTTTAQALRVDSGIVGTATTGNTTTLTFAGASTATTTLNGVIGNGSGGGELALTKTGATNLTLSGTAANTYTGLTTVSGGSVFLAKTAGINSIGGNLTVTSGSVSLSTSNQIIDTSALTISGGSVSFGGKDETVASIALSGGGSISTGNGGGTTTPSTVVVNGAVTASSTSKITVNSGGTLTVGSLALSGTNSAILNSGSGNILIGGNHNTQVTTLNIGSGGLSMTGQSIQVNGATGTAGTRINLNGDVTASGTNVIGLFGTANALAELNMGTGTRTFDVTTANTLGIGLNVAGEILTKTGTGYLTLSGNNTYTGQTNIQRGYITAAHNNALGSTAGATVVAAGAALRLSNNITITGEELFLTGTSSTTTPVTNEQIYGLRNTSGNNEWAGKVNLDLSANNGRFFSDADLLKLSGEVSLSSTQSGTGEGSALVLGGNSAGHGEITGNITQTGSTTRNLGIIKNTSDTWTLSGNNTYKGSTLIYAGTLSVSSIASNLGTNTNAIGLGDGTTTGTLRYTGGGETVSRGFVLRSTDAAPGGGRIEQAGTGNLLINGAITSNTASAGKTLTLDGSNTGTGEITGNISNGTGSATSVEKAGTNTWTLSGTAKSYSGSTTVTQGRLNISTALTNTSSLGVSNGTLALGAANLINDAASVTMGANGTLTTFAGAETMGALAVNGPATLDLSMGASLLNLANSSSQDWTGGMLTVLGWNGNTSGGGAEQVIFGSDSSGLTSTQISQIQFSLVDGLYSAKILASGEIVPDALIPEASSAALVLLGSTGLLARRRRRPTV